MRQLNEFEKYPDDSLLRTRYEELLELCSLLDRIIENFPDSIFVTDRDATILKINQAYEKISGEERSELIGKRMQELEGQLMSKSSTLMVLQKKKSVTIEQKMYRTNRSTHVTSIPVCDADGNISMVISSNRDLNEIDNLKEKLADTEELANEYKRKIEEIRSRLNSANKIITYDKKMLDIYYQARKMAKVDMPVLISGETGSGKGELTKYIHEASLRSQKDMLAINCGAFSASLIESELFGYEQGSFTGANAKGKKGLFEIADGGTLFLDEVGELPSDLQVKLLHVLQNGEFLRIGGTKPVKTNVRIIAATNQDLKSMIENKTFRSDLYYRLNVLSLNVPPLRERPDDILPLVNEFLLSFNQTYGVHKTISRSAYKALREYSWPGNVRELKNVIAQAFIMCEEDKIQRFDLPFIQDENMMSADLEDISLPELTDRQQKVSLDEILERVEASYILKAYETHKTIREAAQSLGMKTTKFHRKKQKYAPDSPSSSPAE